MSAEPLDAEGQQPSRKIQVDLDKMTGYLGKKIYILKSCYNY